MKFETFEGKIAKAINAHSLENGSDTPDFILAEYLKKCLENFDLTLACRKARCTLECDEVFGTEDDEVLNTPSPPSAAQAYRMLDSQEIIQEGDEVLRVDKGWVPSKAFGFAVGSKSVGQYRRP